MAITEYHLIFKGIGSSASFLEKILHKIKCYIEWGFFATYHKSKQSICLWTRKLSHIVHRKQHWTVALRLPHNKMF